MIRVFLFYLIPFLLPFVMYAIYLYFDKRAGGTKGWRLTSASIVAVVGLLLMSISLFILGLTTGSSPDGTYMPPKFKDGKLIDSYIIPKKAD